MATLPKYFEAFDRLLGIPTPTSSTYAQRLREDESIFRRGKRGTGALEPTAPEIANLLIAICATPSIGRKTPDPIEVVKSVRAAALLTGPFESQLNDCIGGLTASRAATFGQFIDALCEDMRSGRYAAWRSEHYPTATIRFMRRGHLVLVNLRATVNDPLSVLIFRNDEGDHGSAFLEQIAQLELFALEDVMKIMGPLREAA